MSQTGVNDIFEVNEALNQLESEDAKVRRKAVRRLGQLKDPMAIGALVKAYQNDPDPGVKQEAEAALRAFRRLELGDTSGGGNRAGRLTRILTLVLLVTVIVNLVFIATKVLKGHPADSGVAITSGSHKDITDSFDLRVKELQAAHAMLRPIFADFQIAVGTNHLPKCDSLPDTSNPQYLQPYTMSAIDARTYPDLGPVNDLINKAVQQYLQIKDDYATFCANKNISDLQATLKAHSGPSTLVDEVDTWLKGEVNDAISALVRAEAAPAATVGPTFTPTTPPTDTPVPTDTPAPLPTAGPTQPPSATPLPGVTPPTPLPQPSTVPPTPTLKPSPTPGYVYQGLTLISLKKYNYKMLVNFDGVAVNNAELKGNIQLFTTYQTDPLTANYDMTINDPSNFLKSQGLFPKYPDVLYKTGSSNFVVMNNIVYEVLPTGVCQTFALSDALRTQFAAVSPESFRLGADTLSDLQPKLVDKENGLLHYTAQRVRTTVVGSQSTETYDIFIASDTKMPLHITYQLTQPANPKAASLTSVSVDYELLGRDDQVDMSSVVVPANCPRQPGKVPPTAKGK